MARKYWLDLFTGKTWEEFLQHGADVSGFRERRKNSVKKIAVGDYLLCYLTGISRFIGVLEVTERFFYDETPIWESEDFPNRVRVKVVYKLEPETAVPVLSMRDILPMFRNLKSKSAWTGFFRGSPVEFKKEDGEVIVESVRKAADNPVKREYDGKKYWRTAKTYQSKKVGSVTVPVAEEEEQEEIVKPSIPIVEQKGITHEEIQWVLLNLGSKMGLDLWVARNDRGKSYEGRAFKDIDNLRADLPRQFDEATNKTIEFIDVLWLQRDAIVAAFEVEHTTAIYAGLLRMGDLISMQPNIKINLYVVAPDEKREKVITEINRPTFARLKPPLPKICKFIGYSVLKNETEALGDRIKFMKFEFIDQIAESCQIEEL